MKIDWDKVTAAQLVKMLEIAVEVDKARAAGLIREGSRRCGRSSRTGGLCATDSLDDHRARHPQGELVPRPSRRR